LSIWLLSRRLSGPATNVFADEFVRRTHGQRYRSLHPILDEILAETHGIMVYQEDVMKVTVALSGFSIEDGDESAKCSARSTRIKSLQEDLASRIITEQQPNGSYRSLHDFLDRVKLETTQTILLIKEGCFDSVAGKLIRPASSLAICRFEPSMHFSRHSRTSFNSSDSR
jgi:DNA polymerase III alpha subunit